MIPLRDDNPTVIFPIATISIIVLNIAIFLYEISLGPQFSAFLNTYGAKPLYILNMTSPQGHPSPYFTIFSSMFLHGGLLHVAGNMLYLWIFGNNIEEAMGHLNFIVFYIISGIIAVYIFAFMNPGSTIPMVGASGAVSGVLGAYLVLFPRAKVLTLIPLGFYMQVVRIPAVFVLGLWIAVQILNGMFSGGGGIAWFAHIGGFLAGILLVGLFKKRGRQDTA